MRVTCCALGDWLMTDHCGYSLLLFTPSQQPRLVGSLAAMPRSRNNVHVVAFKPLKRDGQSASRLGVHYGSWCRQA